MFRPRLTILAAALCAVGVLSTAPTVAGGRPDLVEASMLAGREYIPNEMLVQFKVGTTPQMKQLVLGRVGAEKKETVVAGSKRSDAGGDLDLVVLPPGAFVSQAMRGIGSDPAVEFAEPNWVYRHQATSNDTYVTNGSLWGMYGSTALAGGRANQFGIGATTAWAANKTDCGGVYIGVIDEGYMHTHVDLVSNAGTNPGEIPGNGVDDDSNGLVDDVYGWDFDGNNNTVFDGIGDDHGTHVAGTIAASGANGTGVAGVCWAGVKLLSAKFLGNNGGTTANAIKAVDYFTDLKTRQSLDLPATNNSWGGGGFSQALQDAIERANGANILFVAAAGNSSLNCETSNCYPAEYPNANVIAVASITSTGALSSFSNYGSTTIDIGAPGSAIWSTVPGRRGASSYASYSGTSMAAPHVTGAAALYAARNPGATAAQIKAAILNSATATTSLKGRVVTNGRLNVSGF